MITPRITATFCLLLPHLSLAQSWSGAAYDDWAGSSLFGISGFEASIYGDPDQDGAWNFIEFGRGTDPRVPDPPNPEHLTPIRTITNDGTVFSFHRMPGLSEVAWNYQLSNNLLDWRNAIPEASVTITPSATLDLVALNVPDSLPQDPSLFGRLGWQWKGSSAGTPLLNYSFDAGSTGANSTTNLVSGANYDATRLGSIGSLFSPPTNTTLGSNGLSGTDVSAQVPVTTWIRNDAPDDNKEDYQIFVGSLAGGGNLRGLVAFDLSSIPDSATLTDATISLYQSGHTTGNNDNEPSQLVDIELFSLTGPVDNDETWNTAASLFDSSLASSTGDPTITTAGIEHQFNSPTVLSELQSALATNTAYFGLASPDLEAQTIRHFFVLDGASASSAIGPSLDLTYSLPATANGLPEVPSDETASTLEGALLGDDYHEFEISTSTLPGDLLTLTFDHLGAATLADFSSNIAVFASTTGFSTPPTSADLLGLSSALVPTSQDPQTPITTASIPLLQTSLLGTLTIRLYFFDDANTPDSLTRLDNLQVHGFTGGETLLRYDFNSGSASPTLEPVPSVTGTDFSASVGNFSSVNHQTYASSIDTGSDLSTAIADNDYQEFNVSITDPTTTLLALKFDHHGSSQSGSFTSNIAVFSSTDGFTTAPLPGEALLTSSVIVTSSQSETDPIAHLEIPLTHPGFTGTLTYRFYFFDDSNLTGSYNRLDSIELVGSATTTSNSTVDIIDTANYSVQIAHPGFRFGITTPTRALLPPSSNNGVSFLGSPATTAQLLSEVGNVITYRLTNGNSQTALAEISTFPNSVELDITLENSLTGEISTHHDSPGAAFGLADRGGWESNANLSSTLKTFPMKQTGHAHRFISSFLIFPGQGLAGASFERENGSVTIGPDNYGMSNASTDQQSFHYFVGSMPEIYAAWRNTRIAEGYPGVAPKMDAFELGWESWDLLRWNTNAATCQTAIQDFLNNGYNIEWAVTGSGFWQDQGTTVSFGLYDFTKYPETGAPLPPDFGDWTSSNGIRWMIGQRTNFVKTGGPHSSNPGESGATMFDTSPDSQFGLDNDYFLEDTANTPVELTSTVFPTVPCYLLDGNVPGAATWFKNLYDDWGVDGVKEDTMMSTPDHTIYNAPMRLIAEGGDLVMARCAAYSSPGTLTRVNDTGGASSMTLRCPINYLQYAASAAPNTYSDTIGFGNMGNVTSSLRHAWLLSLTAGLAVSDSPWNHSWSAPDQAKLKKIVDFHYELGPYLHSAAIDSHATGYPHTMTPLPIAFPDDPNTYNLASSTARQFEWMIGPSLLAAPLLHANYASSSDLDIYLPAGSWIDIETGTQYLGPTTLGNFNMPLDKTPVFVGGKGVYISRNNPSATLDAVVFPIANGGSTYTFTHPDGSSTSTITNNNTGWNTATILVTNTTLSTPVAHTADPTTGSIRFPITAGHDYMLTAGN